MRTCQDIQEAQRIISKSQTLKQKSATSKDGQLENVESQSKTKLQELWSTKAFQERLERLKKSHHSLTNKYSQRHGGLNKKDTRKGSEIADRVSQVRHDADKNNRAKLNQCDGLNELETTVLHSEKASVTKDSLSTEKDASSVTSSISLGISSEQNGSTSNTAREDDVKISDFRNESSHLNVEFNVTKSSNAHRSPLEIIRQSDLNAQNDSKLPVVGNGTKRTFDHSKGPLVFSGSHEEIERVHSPDVIWRSLSKDEISVSEKLNYSNMVRARLLNGGNIHSLDMECYGKPSQIMSEPLPNSPSEDFNKEGRGSVCMDSITSDMERIRCYNEIQSQFKGIEQTTNAKSGEIIILDNFVEKTIEGENQGNCASGSDKRLSDEKANMVDVDKNLLSGQNITVGIDANSIFQTESGHFNTGERIQNIFKDKKDGTSHTHAKMRKLGSKKTNGNQFGNTNKKHPDQGVDLDNLYSKRSFIDQIKDNMSKNISDPLQYHKTHVVNVDDQMYLNSNSLIHGEVCQNTIKRGAIENASHSPWLLGNDTLGRDENDLKQVFDADLKGDAISIKELFGCSIGKSQKEEHCDHGNSSITTPTSKPSRVSIFEHSSDKKQKNKAPIFCSQGKCDGNNCHLRTNSDLYSPKSANFPLFSSSSEHSITPCSRGSDVIEEKHTELCYNVFCSPSDKCLLLRSSRCSDYKVCDGERNDKEITQTVQLKNEQESMQEKKTNYAEIQRKLQEFKKRAFIRKVTKGFDSLNVKGECKRNRQPKRKGTFSTNEDNQNSENVNKKFDDSVPGLNCVLTGSQVQVSAKPDLNVKKYKPRVKIKLKSKHIDNEKQDHNGKRLGSGSVPKIKKQQSRCFKVSRFDISKLQPSTENLGLSQVNVSNINHRKDSSKTLKDSQKRSDINHYDGNQENPQNRQCIQKDRNISKSKLTDTSSTTNQKSETESSTGSTCLKYNRGNKDKMGRLGFSISQKEDSKDLNTANTLSGHRISLPNDKVEEHHTTRNSSKEFSIYYHNNQACAASVCTNAGHSDGEPPSQPLADSEIPLSVYDGNVVSDVIQINPVERSISSLKHEDQDITPPVHPPDFPHGHEYWRRTKEAAEDNRNLKDESDDSSASKTYRSLITDAITKARAQADKYKCVWGNSNKSKSVDKESIPRNCEDTKPQTAKSTNCTHLPLIKNRKLCDFQSMKGINSNNNSCAEIDTDTNGKTEQQTPTGKSKQVQSYIQDNLNMCLSSEFGSHPSHSIAKNYNKNLRVHSRKNQRIRKSKIPVLIKPNSQEKMGNRTQGYPLRTVLSRDNDRRHICHGSRVDNYSNNRNINRPFLLRTQTSEQDMDKIVSDNKIATQSNTNYQTLLSHDLISPQISSKNEEVINSCGCLSASGKVFALRCKVGEPISDFEKMLEDGKDQIQGGDAGLNEGKTRTFNEIDEIPSHDANTIFKEAKYKGTLEIDLSPCLSNVSQNGAVTLDSLSPRRGLIENVCFQTESGTNVSNMMTKRDITSTEGEPESNQGVSLIENKPDQRFLQIIYQKVASMKGHKTRTLEICDSLTNAGEPTFSSQRNSTASQVGPLGDIGRECMQIDESHTNDLVALCSKELDGLPSNGKSLSFANRTVPETTSILGLSGDAECTSSVPASIEWPIPIKSEFSPKISRRPQPRSNLCEGITVSSPDSAINTEPDHSPNFQAENLDHVQVYTKTTTPKDIIVYSRRVQSENDAHSTDEEVSFSDINHVKSTSPEVHQGAFGYCRFNVRVDRKDNKRVRFRKGSLTFCKEPPLCIPVIESNPDYEATSNRPESMTDVSTDTDHDKDSSCKSIHLSERCRSSYNGKLGKGENEAVSATVHCLDIECNDYGGLEIPTDEETDNDTQDITVSNTTEDISDIFTDSGTYKSPDIRSMLIDTINTEVVNVPEDVTMGKFADSRLSDYNADSYLEDLKANKESFDGVISSASKESDREKVYINNEIPFCLPPLSKRQAGRPHKEMRKRYY